MGGRAPEGEGAVEAISTEPPPGRFAYRFEGADHGSSVSFFLTSPEPGMGPGLHRHPYDETHILEEGRATFTVDGEQIELEAGQAIVVPAGAAHTLVNSGDGPMRLVSIHPAPRMEQEWL